MLARGWSKADIESVLVKLDFVMSYLEYPFWVLSQKTLGKRFQLQHINVTNILAVKEKQYPYKNFIDYNIIYMMSV